MARYGSLYSAFRRRRQYEIHYPSGEHRVVTLRQMDAILNGRSFPADFWGVVSAADLRSRLVIGMF